MTQAEERAQARAAARAETARRWNVIAKAILAGTAPPDATPADYDWTQEPEP